MIDARRREFHVSSSAAPPSGHRQHQYGEPFDELEIRGRIPMASLSDVVHDRVRAQQNQHCGTYVGPRLQISGAASGAEIG